MSDFLETLDMLGAPLFALHPGGPAGGYWPPPEWQTFTPDRNDSRLGQALPGYGYGMLGGHVYTAIDIDPRNGGTVAYLIQNGLVPEVHYVVLTKSGGWHLYVDPLGTGKFSIPGHGIDVQDHGSFVFVPPTPNYRVLPEDEWPAGLAEAQDPAALDRLRALQPARRTETPSGDPGVPLDLFSALERLEGVYRRMSAAEHGERNATLNLLAGTAAGIWVRLAEGDQRGNLSEDAIKDRLLAAVPDDGDPDKSRDTIARGWDYGLGHPVPDRQLSAAGFYDETPVLQHIRDAAHAQGLKAPVVLASVLAYVLRETHPQVFLPATVGEVASLNLGFALVGDSGAGKTAALKLAAKLLGLTRVDGLPIGSGEGLVDAFYEEMKVDAGNGKMKTEWWPLPPEKAKLLLTVDEGETLKQLGGRSGTTLGGFLRSALTGDTIGTTNSKRGGNNRLLEGNTYRLVTVINIHPTQADVLLDGDGVGTPQRFLWMPSEDKELPTRVADLPPPPGQLRVTLPKLDAGVELDYPERIKHEVQQDNLDRAHGKADPRLAHANLTRLKVAQALALLHGEPEITEQWWRLAGVLSDLSLATQDACSARLAANQQEQRNTRAKVEGRAAEAADEDRFARGVQAIVEKLRKRPGVELSWHDARPSHLLRGGRTAQDYVGALQEQAGVSVRVKEKGEEYVHLLRYDA